MTLNSVAGSSSQGKGPPAGGERRKLARRELERLLFAKADQLAAVTDAMASFLTTAEWQEPSARLLRNALKQTQSKYGFIGVLVNGPKLRILAHQGFVWDASLGRELYEAALRDYESQGYIEFSSFSNLFGNVITEKRPIISNDPAVDQRSGGLPPGHPPLRNFLGVPITSSSEVVGLIGVANREGGYRKSDLDGIEILCQAVSVLYDNYRQRQRERALERRREQSERALRESELRLQHALAALNGGVWDWNLETNEVYFSPRWSAMLGFSEADITPHVDSWRQLLHPDDEPAVMQRLGDHLKERTGAYRSEHRLRAKSGDWVWILDQGQVVERDGSGRALRMIGSNISIDDGKRAQEALRRQDAQLRQSQKMQAIGELAGGVAHDFNNLLTVITGYGQTLAEALTDDPMGESARQIVRAADQATALTGQLLAFSRQQNLRLEILDLNSIIVDMDDMVRRLVREDIEIIVALQPDLAPVRVDPGQIRQVFLNLIVNASDAMPDGGQLTITTKAVLVDRQAGHQYPGVAPGPHATLAVSDTGVGMDGQTQERIFEPFFTTKGTVGGTGLGLATAYGIIDQIGGHILVSSRPGEGAVFTIFLPHADAAVTVGATDAEKVTSRGGSERILVVEDESAVRIMIRESLKKRGYQVLEASRPSEALELFGPEMDPIDLIVIDIVMPEMNGRELARRVIESNAATRVLFVSGYPADALGGRSLTDPGLDFLQKPFTPERLAAKVRELLDRSPD